MYSYILLFLISVRKQQSYKMYYKSNIFTQSQMMFTDKQKNYEVTNKDFNNNKEFVPKYELTEKNKTSLARKIESFYDVNKNDYYKSVCEDAKSRASSKGHLKKDFYE